MLTMLSFDGTILPASTGAAKSLSSNNTPTLGSSDVTMHPRALVSYYSLSKTLNSTQPDALGYPAIDMLFKAPRVQRCRRPCACPGMLNGDFDTLI
ncbi:hypothetical protein EB796_018373 [Bugula neritina]|uniref:Uncharacterized protein n=1 Tax=Bugula neritina TaxID=10212 RepID=A0A7J7JCG3_BUGNE|nr:hypothetical protein EB796_018373 [Bugula neritina]